MLMELVKLFLWFLFYSFCGWVYESILVSIQERRLVNRGFLNGPLCPIYGTGAVLATLILGQVRSPVVVFLVSAIGATVLEYVTSWAMERLFHARWWDYSDFKFNLNGRVCLLGAVVFGIGGVVIVFGVQPWVAGVTDMIPGQALCAAALVCFVTGAIDLAVTVVGMGDFASTLDALTHTLHDVAARAGETWQWGSGAVSAKVREWSTGSQDTLKRMRQAVSDTINAQQRRMLESFPKLRVPGKDDVLSSLRELMRPKR